MNSRIYPIVAVLTLVTLSSGCSGMKNFLFGRGARCGLCNSNSNGMAAPQFGNTMQTPSGTPSCGQQPPANGPAPCGSAPYYGSGYSCGNCGQPTTADCGCGYVDPYMTGGAVMTPQGGPVMAPIEGDNFNARRFDADGSRILWEQPYYEGNSL